MMLVIPLVSTAVASILFAGSLLAQEEPAPARWWIGGTVGMTDLGFDGELHYLSPLHADLAGPDGFVAGGDNNLLVGMFIEHDVGRSLGGALAIHYDDRSMTLWNSHRPEEQDRPYSRRVTTSLRYLSIEANIRVRMWMGLTLLLGPGIGLNIRNRLTYLYTPPARQISNPDYPDRLDYGWLEQARNTIVEGQVTLRWDFPLDSPDLPTAGIVAAPFLTYKLTGNLLDPPEGSSNSYSATTFRVGLELKVAVAR